MVSYNKMDKHRIALHIWNEIFENLYDRSQFDWWWDNIDDDVKREIRKSIVTIIEKHLIGCNAI